MDFLKRTKEFFADGGMIFSSKHNFLGKSVQALGLAAAVTIFPPSGADARVDLATQNPVGPVVAAKMAEIVKADTPMLTKLAARLKSDTVAALRASWDEAQTELGRQNAAELVSNIAKEGVGATLYNAADYVAYHAEQTAINVSVHEFGQYKVSHFVAKEIVRAANDTNFPVETLFAIAEKESSFNIIASPQTSSAYGLMQFLDQKWLEMVKTHGASYGLEYEAGLIQERAKGNVTEYFVGNKNAQERILNLRTSPYLSTVFTAINLLDAKNKIENRVNAELKNEELYLPHFLGTNGAGRLIEQSTNKPNTSAAKVFPDAAKANKNMFRSKKGKALTISQFKDQIVSAIEKRTEKYNNVESVIAEVSAPKNDETKSVLLASFKR